MTILYSVDMAARLVLAALWLFACSLVALFLLPFGWKNPSMGYIFGQMLAFGAPKIFGFNIVVENPERMRDHQPCIYIANHQSNLDIVTMAQIFPPRCVIIGKRELLRVPLFGLFFWGAGNILIDRRNAKHAIGGMEQAAEHIRENQLSVWVFPEGTRNRGAAKMLPFKKGAFHLAIRAQIPIVPIAHIHLFKYFDFKRRRVIRGPGHEVRIKIMEPVSTKGLNLENVPQLMTRVQDQMQAQINALSD